MAEPQLELVVSGIAYGGWKEIEVTRSIETVAGTFSLQVSERWPGQPEEREIATGDRCTVQVGGEVVITGYVEDVDPGYEARQHDVSVRGRDVTGDLVDCSPENEPGEWLGRRVEQIAADLCAPFGVAVRAEVSTGAPLRKFRLQEGESVLETIERMCRLRGLLRTSDGRGALVLTRAGTEQVPTMLVRGQNILRARGQKSSRDRFSHIVVKGQQAGTDDVYGEAAAHVLARATDPDVSRYRPLVIIGEDQMDTAAALARARWEASVRAARSVRVTYTVQGWRHGGGLWRPNVLVAVRDSFVDPPESMLITGVTFRKSEQGTTTDLTLSRRDAFVPEPLSKEDAKEAA